MLRGGLLIIWSLLMAAAPALALQQPPSGFVPVDQLPQSESLPAAPLLIAAYAFVWAVVFLCLFSIWRRLGKVEADMQSLERRLSQRTSAR